MRWVYVFNASKARFAGDVFETCEAAEEWIERHRLSGVLTKYPVDTGVYDYAVEAGLFTPKNDDHLSSAFIGSFTSAYIDHFHYEDGVRTG